MAMERSEPALVPGWLKSSGGVTRSGSADHHSASLSSHSDEHPGSRPAKEKSSTRGDSDISRTFASERTTSSYFRRSSSGNSYSHSRSYSNFGRNHRDRDREDINSLNYKSSLGDKRRYEFVDPLGNVLPSRFEKESLRRSQSMVTGKASDITSQKVTGNLTNASRSSKLNGSVLGNMSGAAFERDFPSLGNEDRPDGPEIGRVSSPGLSSSAVIGRDNWTSALAEVPVMVGSNSTNQQNVLESLAPTMSGLNMAEALAQGPSCVRTSPQVSVGTQRLEELAIKQSRQLIPVTPSMPKVSGGSSSEKSKAKVGHQQLSLHSVNSPRGGSARSDGQKTLNDVRLRVLKPSRELNGVLSAGKEISATPTNGNKVVNSPLGTPLATGSTPARSSSNSPKFGVAERNPGPFQMIVEKKPMSQTQSRSDFFNLLKKKSSASSSSSTISDPSAAVSPRISDKADEIVPEDRSVASVTQQAGHGYSSESSVVDMSTGNGGKMDSNGDSSDGSREILNNGEKHSSANMNFCPSEEEAAFMRSLGWEENTDEDEGLTEEEINAFFQKYMKLIPPSKVPKGVWSVMPYKQEDGCPGSSSGANSLNSK